MTRNVTSFGAAILAAILLVSSAPRAMAEDDHAKTLGFCATSCSACQLECASCFDQCMTHVANGHKDHAATARLCADCEKCCALVATLCAGNSPLAAHLGEGCAKCCDDCAAACEKFPDDKHMAACAKSCRDCAKSCHDMVKMMGGK